eukprot:125601-Alexandrium_andersonii.AAC.1
MRRRVPVHEGQTGRARVDWNTRADKLLAMQTRSSYSLQRSSVLPVMSAFWLHSLPFKVSGRCR